jgi:hypothetical protein
MQAARPIQIDVSPSAVWCATVGLLVAVVCIAMSSWWLAQPVPVPRWVSAASVIGPLLALLCGCHYLRPRRLTLRWDGQYWHLTEADNNSAPETPGEVSVAIDIGQLMLLCFVPNMAPGVRGATWMMVQRYSLSSRWHALRCAVYSPQRFRPGRDAETDLRDVRLLL